MNKKLFLVLTVCLLACFAAVAFSACGKTKLDNPRQLNVTDDDYFTWAKVDGADGYVVYFNENDGDRYYITNNYISVNEPEIRSSLSSGQVNTIYIRAVKLGDNRLPVATSDRSMIKFNYSRQLATPNKVSMKNGRFSWRGVTDAKDYKALVRTTSSEEGVLYDMTWKTGAASITGEINDLPAGYTYYVSIVATAEGYENSEPSVEVPFDKSVVNLDATAYSAKVGDETYAMNEEVNEDGVFTTTLSAVAGDKVKVVDNNGKEYEVASADIYEAGDFLVSLNASTGKASVSALGAYYLYLNGTSEAKKLTYNTVSGNYAIAITLNDSDTYVIKDASGNLLSTFADGSANQGTAFTGGKFVITVGADATISVSAGTSSADTDSEKPRVMDGKWRVIFDYNFEGAPEAYVTYAQNNRAVATPSSPTRTGYVFDGWYEDTYLLIKADFGKKQSNFAVTSPMKFYAKWTKEQTIVEEHLTHIDMDGDWICDVCGKAIEHECEEHVDENNDGKCDVCGKTVEVVCTEHKDENKDGKCDFCGVKMPDEVCNRHYDLNGNGYCDNCGKRIDVTVDTYGTIYLDVSDFDWFGDDGAIINVHIWYTDGYANSFPGDVMTYNSTGGYYEAQYITSRTVKGVLFTRNNPNPVPGEGEKTEWDRIEVGEFRFDATRPVYKLTSYFHSSEDNVYFEGTWLKVGEKIEDEGNEEHYEKLYIDFRNVDWFMDASPVNMVYIWYTDGTNNGAYPGKQLIYTTDATSKRYSGYVYYEFDKTIAGVIFTRNDPNGTIGDEKGVWNKIELKAEDMTLSFDRSKPAYRLTVLSGYVFEGYWVTEEEALNAPDFKEPEIPEEPEIVIDDGEDAFFCVDVSAITWFKNDGAKIKAKIVYTDDSVNHENGADATVDDDLLKWLYNSEKTVKSVTILRVNPVEGNVWNEFDVVLGGENKEIIVVTALNDGVATYGYKKYGDTEPTTVTIYFSVTNGWENVKVYAWSKVNDVDGASNADWPGVQTEYVGENELSQKVFKTTLSLEYNTIIFNNGSGGGSNQSVAISFDENSSGFYATNEKDDLGSWKLATYVFDQSKIK